MQDTAVVNIPADITPGAMFTRIWDDDLQRLVVDMTNERLREERKRQITSSEFRLYLAQYLQTTLTNHRDIRNVWKDNNRDPRALSKHRFFHVQRHRTFPIIVAYDHITERTRHYVVLGSELCIDELQSDWSGYSPVTNFNPSKPHPWGQLSYLCAVRLNGRSLIISAKPRTPDYYEGHPTTHDVVRDLLEVLPQDDYHITMDAFYNTVKTREYLDNEPHRFYTMAGNIGWLPHVWRTMGHQLPHGQWRQMVCTPKHLVFSCFHSTKKVHTLSNAFTPTVPPPITPAIPPLFQVYRSNFNLVDLFNRIYFSIPFGHKQLGWENNFFDVFLKIALINSWVLFNAATHFNPLTIREFIARVVEYLYANPI